MIQITKELKVKLLRDLQRGKMSLNDYPEFQHDRNHQVNEFSDMSDDELREMICGECPHFTGTENSDNREL